MASEETRPQGAATAGSGDHRALRGYLIVDSSSVLPRVPDGQGGKERPSSFLGVEPSESLRLTLLDLLQPGDEPLKFWHAQAPILVLIKLIEDLSGELSVEPYSKLAQRSS